MVERGTLKPPTPGQEPSGSEGPRPTHSRDQGLLKGDQTVARAVSYWLVLLILFVASVGEFGAGWRSTDRLHLVLETSATLMAFVAGSLALVRYYSKRKNTFLFIGTGFLGTGLLDFVHAVLSSTAWRALPPMEAEDRSAWSFTASGTILSVFLFVSWLSWRRERAGEKDPDVSERSVYLTAVVLSSLILLVFFYFPSRYLPQAVYPDQAVTHPGDFFPAFFFALALLGYVTKGHWRSDGFEHWLIMALIVSVMVHGTLMPFSRASHDLAFDLAHFLKVASYICVLVGLLSSVYTTMRREGEAAHVARTANTALAKEIDTRRKAERILQESEERLQDFLDNAHDLIQSVDPQGKLIYVNRAWERTLGYGPEDRKDLNFFDILDDACRDRCSRDFRSVLDGKSLPVVEVSLRARDGRIVFCSGSANARFEDGKPVATRTILRDISESRAARRELEAFQANLQALVENTGDAIWSVNRSLQLITFNTAFSMALEVRTGKEPGMGGLPEDVFPKEDAGWYREMYQRALRGEAFSELRDEEIGSQVRSFELFFNPIREAMGITGVAIFGKDVTARRRTQLALRMAKEEAERANLAKSQFLANMSHELRTPLNSVIGFTNVLLKNRGGKLEAKELGFLERISANGRHLLELINEVLDLAKIEAGRMELELQSVDLGELIRETLAQMEGQVKDKDLALRADIPEGLRPLETDSGKLKQVIINLVGNALKFTERGEVVVEVATLPERSSVSCIRVRDTGIGIPPDRLQAIFEAFQQADGTTTRRFGGTGLGLTISRSLCQLMGYDLKVESTEGEGSVFTILMANVPPKPRPSEELLIEEALRPISSSRPRMESRDSESGPQGSARGEGERSERKKRVLVIDDEADSRILLTHLLEDLGFEVETASSAADGLRKVRSWSPNLILLDLKMPEVGGLEFLSWLREREELMGLPILVCTGKDLDRKERIQLQEQVFGVVFKGKNLDIDLKEALARFLPRSSPGSENPG